MAIRIQEIFLLAFGTLIAALGLIGFLLPNHFVDGGITGLALLLKHVANIPVAGAVLVLNIPFMFLALRHLSREFAIRTFLGIVFLTLWLVFVRIPTVTEDKILIAVFGGMLIGGGLGLSMRAGAVIDGTEILALVLTRVSPLSIGNTILSINSLIFIAAAFIVGLEPAMYSVLTYFTVAKTVDFVVSGIEEYTGVTIISEKTARIKTNIQEVFGRGVTIYLGKSGYHSKDIDILYTVVTRLELMKLKSEVSNIDPKAVIIEHTVNDVRGGVIKKRKLRFD